MAVKLTKLDVTARHEAQVTPGSDVAQAKRMRGRRRRPVFRPSRMPCRRDDWTTEK